MLEWGDFLIWRSHFVLEPRIYPLPCPIHVCEMSVPPRHRIEHSLYKCGVLLATVAGGGRLECNHKTVELTPGTVALADPLEPDLLRYGPIGDTEWRFIEMLVVPGNPMLIQAFNHQFGVVVEPEDFDVVLQRLRSARTGADSEQTISSIQSSQFFLSVVEAVYKNGRRNLIYDSHIDLAQEAKQYIEQESSRLQSVDQLASALGVSSGHLSRVFRDEFGCGLHEYINRVRIGKAEALLVNTDLGFAEIAEKVGIDKLPSFFRTFKRVAQMTPRNYRRTHRTKTLPGGDES